MLTTKEAKVVLELSRAPGGDDAIMTGIACPFCGDYYLLGTYFITDERDRVLVSAESIQCVNCGVTGLPNPHLFQSVADAQLFFEAYECDDSSSWLLDSDLIEINHFPLESYLTNVRGFLHTV